MWDSYFIFECSSCLWNYGCKEEKLKNGNNWPVWVGKRVGGEGCQRGQRFLYDLRHAKEREHILSKINPKGNDIIS